MCEDSVKGPNGVDFPGYPTSKPNFYMLPIYHLDTLTEYNEMVGQYKELGFGKVKRTKSGGISHSSSYLGKVFDSKVYPALAEITVCDVDGWKRIQFQLSQQDNDKKQLSGTQAFNKLTRGIKFKDIREKLPELPKWYRKELAGPYEDLTIDKAHHIDLNSCFAYYLAEIQPALRDRIYSWYPKRKTDSSIKDVFNYGIGCFRRRFPNTWKKIMYLVHDRLEKESKLINGTILAYNTDGIWFTGEYIGKTGTGLGQVKLDHKDCMIRFKSAGSYEYIENGVYKPVVSGVKRGLIKEWGDIYKHYPKGINMEDDYLSEVILYGY